MKDFKKVFYISNCPWKRKIDFDSIKKFSKIPYTDNIIFNFDLDYSITKVSNLIHKTNDDNKIIISSINICMRYYGILSKIYPYNSIRVVIHTNNNKYYNILRPVVDLIPDFAVIITKQQQKDIENLDKIGYKHIVYGLCSNLKSKIKNTECQSYYTINGILIVK